VRLGVLGAGKIVPFHLDAMLANGFEPHVIGARRGSVNAGNLAIRYGFEHQLEDPMDIFKIDIDCLLIASPANTLLEYLVAGLKLGLPILIEKPVFLEPRDFLIALDSGEPKVLVGYNRRFYHSTALLKSILNPGHFNSVRAIIPELSWSKERPSIEEVERNLRENTVHVIDLMNFLFKLDENNWSVRKPRGSQRFISLLFNSPVSSGQIDLVFGYPGSYQIQFFSDSSALVLSPLEILQSYDSMTVIEPTELLPIRQYVTQTTPLANLSEFDYSYKPGFYLQAKAFRDLVKGEVSQSDGATLSDAYVACKVADIACRALKSNC